MSEYHGPKFWELGQAERDARGAGRDPENIFYVPEKVFAEVKTLLHKNGKISEELVQELYNDTSEDSMMMIPVDLAGSIEGPWGYDCDTFEQMMEKLGAHGTANFFVKAREQLLKDEKRKFDHERHKPMSSLQWRSMWMYDDDYEQLLKNESASDEECAEASNPQDDYDCLC